MSTLLKTVNEYFPKLDIHQRIEFCLDALGPADTIIQSSSFGLQSAVLLHLMSVVRPSTPVFFVNTGYLFKETLAYAKYLKSELDLNVVEIKPKLSPKTIENKYGQLWLNGAAGIEQFNSLTKLQPLQQALAKTKPTIWLSGVRRQQSQERQNMLFAVERFNTAKIHPMLDWTDKMVHEYMVKNHLPRHPLEAEGYLSVGDTVTTQSLHEVDDPSDTRFMGFKRECGLHA